LLAAAVALALPFGQAEAAVLRVITVAPGGAAPGVAPVPAQAAPLAPGAASLGAAPTLSPLPSALPGPRVLGVTPAVPADVAVARARYPALAATLSGADPVREAAARAAASSLPLVDGERARRSGEGRVAAPQEAGAQGGAQVDVEGAGAAAANDLSSSLAALGPGAGKLSLREAVGAAFDGSGKSRAQEVAAVDAPLGAAEVFGRSARALKLPSAEADRLAGLGDRVAQWRGVRAAQGEAALAAEQAAVLRGIDDLARAAAIGRTDPAVLRVAADVVGRMAPQKLDAFIELGLKFVGTEVPGRSTPFAMAGNVEHIAQQLLDPLREDGAELAAAFKTDRRETPEHFVKALKALQIATDTGKQENPADLKAALALFNPPGPVSYINNYILPHEYASMVWAQTLGRQAGFTPREILAFQRLIANHNFGPDLTRPENAQMREHWWAKNFREQMLPMMQAMGIDVEAYFNKDEEGRLQYNHTQGHPIPLMLSVYDRAIAVPANGNGIATWKKYGTQDFNQKKGRLKGTREANAAAKAGQLLRPDPEGAKDEEGVPGPLFEFDGPSIISAMEATADWAEQHVESLWSSVYAALPAESPVRARYPDAASFRQFPPYYRHRKSIGSLVQVLRYARAANPQGPTNRADIVPKDGVAYYEVPQGELAGVYRVTLERVGPGAFDQRSTDYSYAARLEVRGTPGDPGGGWKTPTGPRFGTGAGKIAVSGVDPVALYTDLIRAERGL
ncbi:MAG: hypothetical protein HY928_08355, partial [Elusimicrobia bacterium]|nr:hypothetical protein [Elusimicrobiota bacterium]